jgi:hypothetical protein
MGVTSFSVISEGGRLQGELLPRRQPVPLSIHTRISAIPQRSISHPRAASIRKNFFDQQTLSEEPTTTARPDLPL